MTWFPNRVMKAEKEILEYYSTKFINMKVQSFLNRQIYVLKFINFKEE